MGRVSLCLVIMFFICSAQKIDAQVQNIREKQDTISATKSLEHIRPENIKKGPLNNALDVLSGQSAGVNVTTNGTDRLAMLNSIRVRGTTSIMGGNDPLVIIDGVTSDIATLSTIYPADIESFTILKNATETAMYGSRGASGVIEIKTKKGTGRGFEISYDGNYGFESMYKHLQMLNGPEYIATAEALGLDYNNGGYNTNFHDVITRTGLIHQHHLAFSGGSENSNYRASFGFMDHNTIVKVNDYRNLVVKLDATQKAFDGRLVGDFGVYGYSSKIHDIFDTRMLFYSAAAQNPTYPAGTDVNGNWVKNSAASHINHPGALLYEKNDSEERNFNTHLGLKFNILDNLILSAFGSYSYSSTGNAQFCPTWVWAQGNVYRGEFKGEDYFTNVSLSYNNAWGDSHLDAVVGAEYLKQVRTGLWVQAKGITTNDFSYNNIGATSSRPFGGTSSSYWKIQCKLPPKTKRFCPLKTFNNAPLKSLDRWGYYYFSLFPSVCSHFTDTFSCQLNPVRRMYNTIHNGICYCRVSDCIIPIVRWQLRGDDDGLAPMSVLYYIEQDGSFLGIKVHKEEVIQYEQRAPFDSLEFRFQCAFYFCHLKRTHKFRSIRIICPYALLAGFIPHCCGKEALPGTG